MPGNEIYEYMKDEMKRKSAAESGFLPSVKAYWDFLSILVVPSFTTINTLKWPRSQAFPSENHFD